MSRNEEIINLIKQKKIVRSADIDALGIPRIYIQRLYKQGKIERTGRGLYTLPDTPASEHSSLIEAGMNVPKGVICLLSALRFHNLTTQLPFEVWLAIEGTAWKPTIDYPPLKIVRFSGRTFHYGIEVHQINHVAIKVYGIAKTIADCFKFRNKIGQDIALEALREALRDKRTTIDDIWQAAKVCRVSNVMKPYLEVI